MIHQAEVAECGLACLAMVGQTFGHDLDMPSLRMRFGSSLKGTTLGQIIGVAKALGMAGRPLKVELSSLRKVKLPAVLHWDLNHFVVLKSITAKHAVVHDPAYGVRRISIEELSTHFTGIVLELSKATDFAPVHARRELSVRSLAGTVRGVGTALFQMGIVALALEALNLLGPFYMQWIMDHVLLGSDRELLTLLGIGFLTVAVFQTALAALRSWIVTWLGATINVQWASNVASHLLRLPLWWFERRHVGDVVSRLGAVQNIQRTLTTQFVGSILDGAMSVATLVVLGLYSVPLMLLVLGMFAAYAAVRTAFFSPLRRATEAQIVAGARQQSEILESIRAMMPIKLAVQEDARASRYANATVHYTNRDVAAQRLTIVLSGVSQFIFSVGRVVLLWLAATRVLDGEMSAGMLVAFVAYADQFATRSAALMDKCIEFRMLGLQAERLSDITGSEIEPAPATAWDGPLTEASVELRNVSFRYSDAEPWILKNVTLCVEAGEAVAIVGPSGAGKTTLAKIVAGLLKPVEGEVIFAGVPIEHLGMARLRRQMATVMQEDCLVAGSIAENIVFGATGLDAERLVSASQAAAIHQDIARMPMGYQSPVGDMGSSLSGGQKQRVILARALYRQPRLLLLDEATSHLDVACERTVNASLAALRTTRIVIAHRPETIAMADRVIDLGEFLAASLR
jgi:ATP-binding cassette subfamily B protein RaxB